MDLFQLFNRKVFIQLLSGSLGYLNRAWNAKTYLVDYE